MLPLCLATMVFAATLALAAEAFIVPKGWGAYCADAGKRCSLYHYLGCCDSTLSCIKKTPSTDDDVVHGRLQEEETYCLKRAAASKSTPPETTAMATAIVPTTARPSVTTPYAVPTTRPPTGTIATASTMPASTSNNAARTTTSLEMTGTKTTAAKQTSASKTAAGDTFIQQILDVHNKYRAEVGSPALTWSTTLSSDALQWANHLAASPTLSLVHSGTSGQGENLWGGSSNYFSYTQMVQCWADEKADFTGPTFTSLAGTGRKQIGHYTQMVWKTTTQIGCAVGTGNGNDYLVCRYTPQGNIVGRKVY